MREISQLLAVETDSKGKPYNAEEAAALYARLWDEFRDSDTGIKLLERGGPDIMDRVLELYGLRYMNRPPAIAPAFEALEEIGKDLLLTLPERVELPKKINIRPTAPPKVRKPLEGTETFAKRYNDHLMNVGARGLKPQGGYVLLESNGIRHSYSMSEFEAFMNDAMFFNLLR
jgi:hypothetical protein